MVVKASVTMKPLAPVADSSPRDEDSPQERLTLPLRLARVLLLPMGTSSGAWTAWASAGAGATLRHGSLFNDSGWRVHARISFGLYGLRVYGREVLKALPALRCVLLGVAEACCAPGRAWVDQRFRIPRLFNHAVKEL